VSPTTAVYVRASSRTQDTHSQEPDLRRWVAAQKDARMRWYRDHFTGSTMDRPGFARLMQDVQVG
jgi:DNA invertase Pin-like site-specific DNA recombinase